MGKIIQKATLKLCVVLTMLAVVFFIVINFSSVGVAGLKSIVSNGEILDFQRGFSFDTAVDLLSNLGESGRAFYLRLVVALDFIFPLTYGLFAFGWIALLLKQMEAKKSYHLLLFLPISAMLADWSENIGIITLLHTYPNLSTNVVYFTSAFGIIKWLASTLSILTIAILFVVLLNKKIHNELPRSKTTGYQWHTAHLLKQR